MITAPYTCLEWNGRIIGLMEAKVVSYFIILACSYNGCEKNSRQLVPNQDFNKDIFWVHEIDSSVSIG